nr:GNAT family N-acetyltransferase [Actinomycetota bacterium]
MSNAAEEPRGGSYPYKWETDTILSDGRTVAIRPIKPSDAGRIEAFHGRLSPESIYFRFFTPMPKLSEAMLSRFVNVDYVDRMALVALLGDVIIAVARYDRLPGSGTAEVAFLVDDAHQGRGLATLMLEFLVEAAREAGIHRFIADTLPENARMLRVFRDAGFADTRAFEDGVIRVTFDIEPTAQSVKRMQDRERLAVARSVRRIVAPKSIAVVGASRDIASVGNVVFRNILESSFEGPVYPVNRAASHVSSVRAYPSLSAIPDDIDLVVVAVPAEEIATLVQEAAEKQIGGMVIISSGFSDTSDEGAQAERELVRLARKNGMRVVGPASMGVANTSPLVSLNATLAP